MTVEELLELLHDLPVEALDKQVYFNDIGLGEGVYVLEPVTGNCGDEEVLGYILVNADQLMNIDKSQVN